MELKKLAPWNWFKKDEFHSITQGIECTLLFDKKRGAKFGAPFFYSLRLVINR